MSRSKDHAIDAVLRNDIVALKNLIQQGSQIDMPDNDGRTPLIHAAIDGNTEALTLLLEAKADPNSADNTGKRSLHYAGINQNSECIKMLIRYGAAIDADDNDGNTPLSDAIFYCKTNSGAAIRALVSLGANPDRPNAHGVTPRSLAESIANYNISQHLS